MIAPHDWQAAISPEIASAIGKDGGKEPPSRNRTFTPLFSLLPRLRPHRSLSVCALLALTSAALISLALPMAVRRMVDHGFNQADGAFINRYFLMLIALAVALAIASAARYYFVTTLGERLVTDLRLEVFHHIIRLPAAFFDRNRSGEIASRLVADATQIKSAVSLTASVALRNSILCLGALAMMFVTSPGLSAIALGAIPLVVAPLVLFGRSVRKKSRVAQDALAEASAYASEIIAASRTVQAFNGEDAAGQRYGRDVDLSFDRVVAASRARALLTAIAITLVFVSVVGVLWLGAHKVLAGTLSPGSLSQFLIYAVIAAGSLGSLSEVWGELSQAAGAAGRLFELLNEQTDEREPHTCTSLRTPTQGGMELHDVRFSYPGAPEKEVLSGLSFRVSPGETVALVGPSGSGKSTVFSLLLGFYENQAGSISIDGRELALISPQTLRKEIAIVPQEVTMFAASVYDNIAFGRPDALREDVIAASIKAQAHGFVTKLPNGYGSVLGERGLTLSGGQRQRLAIARAMLRNAPILLLDEATASLDAENEALVQRGLEELMEARTTIVIAHRLATVLKADRILVMDKGKIVEEGTHASLMRQGGLYTRLAELQFKIPAGLEPEQHAA
ncbi:MULTISPECIES: ABC transporter transmembrane domain-containing protein [unclassified Rhizobium]|uniref:ABC transporter transmembrane domain-containing protein n=1 Tax=unclassified Rhizobium TaxID=2613769 RepID=UPI001C84084B|nr:MULTISPECIES: ABC transporter transmembrane domain-containing protein [unclassified Rhizobium]MBX5230683.1 ATP-binding cassette domain-containing protein [Rhizobium sp. NLR9b]MBX5242908.1 ATP-binding cassette domain-containing protein [Rhizobium sp. NLR22b]MBX5291351.1 ATP-binding cassette domain-containing protein [Rhizobium sp. NLR10b]